MSGILNKIPDTYLCSNKQLLGQVFTNIISLGSLPTKINTENNEILRIRNKLIKQFFQGPKYRDVLTRALSTDVLSCFL